MGRDSILSITEIFYSIQGESSAVGRPCSFVRLSGCPLRCTWCDTAYSFKAGNKMNIEEIIKQLNKFPTKLVEITGGEPLAQKDSIELMKELEKENFEILLETSGALSIKDVPAGVKIIMDLKAPGSGEESKNLWDNIHYLKKNEDEIKFVLKDKVDFDYALAKCLEHKLLENFTVLLSPVYGVLNLKNLAQWILKSELPFRMQTQLHKDIWGPLERGV